LAPALAVAGLLPPSALPHNIFPKDSCPLPCLLLTSLLLLLLLTLHLLSSSSSPAPSPPPPPQPRLAPLPSAASAGPAPPSLAFLLTGSAGDADRLHRLLLATYHPRNVYLLLLDRAASADDRARLARSARAAPGRDNVHVVGDPGFANPRGASALAATLHGAALLLRVDRGWDWFVHLDADEYPLVTPDGDSSLHLSCYILVYICGRVPEIFYVDLGIWVIKRVFIYIYFVLIDC